MEVSKRHNKLMEAVAGAKRHMALSKSLDAPYDRASRLYLAAGLYLNEENYQTFEIVECSDKYTYLQFPDFFYKSVVHADENLDDMINLMFAGSITYIGEV